MTKRWVGRQKERGPYSSIYSAREKVLSLTITNHHTHLASFTFMFATPDPGASSAEGRLSPVPHRESPRALLRRAWCARLAPEPPEAPPSRRSETLLARLSHNCRAFLTTSNPPSTAPRPTSPSARLALAAAAVAGAAAAVPACPAAGAGIAGAVAVGRPRDAAESAAASW